METDVLIKELNLIYTIGSTCKWWDLRMTEAIAQAIDAIKDKDLCRVNVNILSRILGEKKHELG